MKIKECEKSYIHLKNGKIVVSDEPMGKSSLYNSIPIEIQICNNDKIFINQYNLGIIDAEIEMTLNDAEINDIPQSKKELLECIQNLMGVFDTPISRRAINHNFAEEVRKIGRQILETNGKSIYK